VQDTWPSRGLAEACSVTRGITAAKSDIDSSDEAQSAQWMSVKGRDAAARCARKRPSSCVGFMCLLLVSQGRLGRFDGETVGKCPSHSSGIHLDV
jgi:hypothetical protein